MSRACLLANAVPPMSVAVRILVCCCIVAAFLLDARVASAQAPVAPTLNSATAGNAQIALAWSTSSGATSYSVFRGTTAGGESTTAIATGITTTSFTNTGLTNGTICYYKVKAVNASGSSGYSNEKSATPVLPAPTLNSATAGNAQIALAWTAVTNATSYSVFRGTTAGGESTTAIQTGVTTTSWTNTGLANGTTYYYKVKAVSSANTSAYSNEKSAAPVLAAPTISAAAGTAQVVISGLSVPNATGYNIYQGTTAGGESTTPVASNVSGPSFTVSGLNNGVKYYFKAAATSAGSTSGYSNEVSATTTLVAVSDLHATASSGSVTLTFTPLLGATSYSVYRGTTSGGESGTAIKTGLTVGTYTDTGRTNGQTYYYYVKVVYPAGTSGASNEASATPLGTVLQINCGGNAVSPFVADKDSSGGVKYSSSDTITIPASVASPAPAGVYQSARIPASGATTFSYIIPSLVAGQAYEVRLHFADTRHQYAGQYPFNVTINGSAVLSDFDIVATAGAKDTAIVEQFNTSADGSGNITIAFSPSQYDLQSAAAAEVSGIEIIAGTGAPATPPV